MRMGVVAVLTVVGLAALYVPTTGLRASPARTMPGVGRVLTLLPQNTGLVVLLEPGDLSLARSVLSKSSAAVYLQVSDEGKAGALRKQAAGEGLLRGRLAIDGGSFSHIFLGNNLADGVVGPAGILTEKVRAEMLRVLRPGGRAMVGSDVFSKPPPAGIDQWSHPYHGPDNNPQSRDTVARAPYLTQFLADPRYAPLPQVAVASGGRIFKAYGHIAFKEREEPLLNTLVAYNGYNGAVLWKRRLRPGIMIHRNTFIATPEVLYVGDDTSCKVIDAARGTVLREIVVPREVAGGTFWKWMALQGGVLYAIVGEDEQRDPVIRQHRRAHGWPWNPLSPGFNQPRNPWGFGRTVVALDPHSGTVKWIHKEAEPIDCRGVCMKDDSLFLFRFGSFLVCLNPADRSVKWRKTAKENPDFFKALGRNLNRQDWRTNWRTTAYAKTNGKALYLAGPMFQKLIAISAADGSILWEDPYDNYQLLLRDDGVWGISGPWGVHHTRRFDPLTGRVLGRYPIGRRACTRPTGACDALFFRAMGGTVRLDAATGTPQWISLMRAQCHDGVTIAHGLLYWWPSTCDCQLNLYGITCVGPAGAFDFTARAREEERLRKGPAWGETPAGPDVQDSDWPLFRHDPACRGVSPVSVPRGVVRLWQVSLGREVQSTAPVAAGGSIFVGSSDGALRCLDAGKGTVRWEAFTGGAIRLPPGVWNGRVYVGSYDGCVYAFTADTGRLAWRFQAAPRRDRIPLYGTLACRWPVPGIVVHNGTVYAASGLANYDGTYVFALDAATGHIRWQNTTSGHLNPEARTGVSVQGQLLLFGGKLFLAGGTSLSPAVYDLQSGRCLSSAGHLTTCSSIHPRGWELSVVGTEVIACGQPFYRHPRWRVYDPSAEKSLFHFPGPQRDVVWIDKERIRCYRKLSVEEMARSVAPRRFAGHMIPPWGRLKVSQRALWEVRCPGSKAVAVSRNAAVVACRESVRAYDLASGRVLWEMPLPAEPVLWGLALDRSGRVAVTTVRGKVLCFGTR